MTLLARLQGDVQPEADLRRTYDAIVIGSGAAGGMAAHVLTSHGMKVLMLEAGKKLDINKELKSMEWPYDHPRRGEMPPGHHALSLNEYTIRSPPTPPDSKYHEGLLVRPGLERHRLHEEHRRRREGASVHRHELRLGARAAARRQDEHLGPPGAAPLRLRLQGEEPRRLRRGLADLLQGHRAVLRQGRSVPRDLRRQGEPAAPARQHVSAADPARELPKSRCASR